MKRSVLVLAGLFLVFGCAKKQTVKPSSLMDTQNQAEEMSKDEPSVRYSDWTEIPQLEAIRFDYDKYELRAEDRAILKRNADYIAANQDFNILVEGHCDERGTVAYNLALGQKRAAAVREYYGRLGVPLGKIGTISYGSEKPVDPNHTEAAWLKNRRAETKVRNR